MILKHSSGPEKLSGPLRNEPLHSVYPRENEVRERIPVPHDNYFQSIFSSRHTARVISEFCSHDRAVWFHVGHQGISYHSSLCALRGRGMKLA